MANPKEKRNYKLDHKLSLKVDDLTFQLHNYDLDLKSNHIYLFGVDRGYESVVGDQEPGIEHVIASRFIRNFNMCMRVNPNKPILIHMKSNGGYWEEGIAIYDTIRSCPWPVTILNYTHARSMTSIIFQAANKRVMMPHSHFMFHDGTYSIDGTVKQVRSAVQFDKRTDGEMLDIYIKSMKESGIFKGKTQKQIKNWLRSQMDKKEDVYLTAQDTVKYGLADEIFDYNWKNLTVYSPTQMSR
jgi:ATP-dependent protease ClpP protease subunit